MRPVDGPAGYRGVDDERVSTSPSGLPGGASEVMLTPSIFSCSSLVPAAACTDGTETPCASPGVGTPPSTGGLAERVIRSGIGGLDIGFLTPFSVLTHE